MTKFNLILLPLLAFLCSCKPDAGSGNVENSQVETSQPAPEIPMDISSPTDSEVPIYSDTLDIQAHNPTANHLNVERDIVPAYLEESRVEIINRTEPLQGETWMPGLDSITNYGFSFLEPSYVDESGGKWYDTFDVFRFSFSTSDQATAEFNRQIKGINAYNHQELQGQGNESRRILLDNEIYFVRGSCSTIWFVRDLSNRIIRLSTDDKGIDAQTMIRTFCGGGAQLNGNPVIAPSIPEQ